MEFNERIKELRLEQKLTQEEFAKKLHVTRQAISNWENNRNLPDLNMILTIATTFNLSLDELLLGKKEVTTLSKKLIEDGDTTKRAKFNMITSIIGGILILIGIICLIIKGLSVEYIDAEGILHENFFLLPIGFLALFSGSILLIGIGLKNLFHKQKEA